MKHKLNIFLFLLLAVSLVSCEDYLDKKEDSGLSEEDIYQDYNSIRGYMDRIFLSSTVTANSLLIYMWDANSYNNGTISIGNVSDEYASVRDVAPSEFVNAGNWLQNANNQFELGSKGNTAISRAYQGIRIVNRVINDIDKVISITDEQKNYLLGQAHFLRAYFYFELLKRYGGMPILDKLYSASDDLDYFRKTYQESNAWMQKDLDIAIANLSKVAWTPEEHGRPNVVMAYALKAMTELYAASPLMQNGLDEIEYHDYNKEIAAEAARNAQKAIDEINSHEYYRLMDHDEYRNIQLVPAGTVFAQPEHVWFTRIHPGNWSAFVRAQWLTQPYDNKTGGEGTPYNAPTQNMVDMFERKGADGNYYPISDSRSGYDAVKSTDPYTDRDPRLANNIIVPGEQWGKDKQGALYYLTTYAGGYSEDFISKTTVTRGAMQTGYMCKKFIWEEASVPLYGAAGFELYRLVSCYIRVAQIYLDLAEASFEATGGNADELVEGCTMTARQALNAIRNRAGIGDLPSGIDFREAYRRERAVELMFEGHRWYDIRRWMIAEDIFAGDYPIKGIKAEPINHSYTAAQLTSAAACKYELTDFTYSTVDVTTEVRVFNKRNYWYPFPMDEVAALDNLQQNPYWK